MTKIWGLVSRVDANAIFVHRATKRDESWLVVSLT